MQSKWKWLSVLLAVAVIGSLFTLNGLRSDGGFSLPLPGIEVSSGDRGGAGTQTQGTLPASREEMERFYDIYRLIQENYLAEVDGHALIDGAIQGMVEVLEDPHSAYMAPQQADEFQQSLESSFEGIGAEVTMQNGRVTILSPIKGSPAEQAGLRPNDQILSVNGSSLDGLPLYEAVQQIRGPKGTEAELLILRSGTEEPFQVLVVRDEIPLETVYAKTVGDYGVIQITQFSLDTAERFREEYDRWIRAGVSGILLDVRGNPGGLLDSVLEIANGLLPEKAVIVQVEDRSGKTQQYRSTRENSRVPMVVLVDQGSASASEILAAALQESLGAPVVGTNSYGKGTVQRTIPLTDGSELKLTTAKWLTPKGNWIHEKGVLPDVEVELPEFFHALPLSGKEVLQRDVNSLEVKNLQTVLGGVGFNPGRRDGYFDERTETALKAFQKANDLPATGVVDKETAQRLNEELRRRLTEEKNDVQLQTALRVLQKQVEGGQGNQASASN